MMASVGYNARAQDASTVFTNPAGMTRLEGTQFLASEGDIRALEHEKAHVAERMAEGVTAIVPMSLAVGVAAGTEGTKYEVATGEYNKMIDKRIAEIKSQCGL